ncbi:MAG: hypothetical protein ACD_12C00356G0001 [uncultured bacterium]|nr:MAG: hypothetical protein ACD_12C00356G0001 [uncultured bacterium]
MKYIIANWKANKTFDQANKWIERFLKNDLSKIANNLEIIICPPYPFISFLKEKTKNIKFIKIGSQDLSFFKNGAYTGEVSIENLSGLIDYAIIGHSERRYYFEETQRILSQKIALAIKYKVKPIYCIRGVGDVVPERCVFLAYEPIYAIGSGNNEPVEKVLKIKKKLRLAKKNIFIYGGSVDEENVNSYLRNKEIGGLLIGSSSLDAEIFFRIVKSAISL